MDSCITSSVGEVEMTTKGFRWISVTILTASYGVSYSVSDEQVERLKDVTKALLSTPIEASVLLAL